MGIEEKAKAYDEAVNKIKPLYEQAKRDGNPIWSTYEYLIPELCESEDERNIDTIFNCLYQCCDTGFISGTQRDNALAWLEKQKESLHIPETCKENANSFTSEQKVPDCCLKCNEYEIGYKAGYEHGCTAGYNKAMKEVDEQKEQKPVEWSKEDEEIFNNIIEKAKGGHWIEVNEITWLITHFKSLRPVKQEWSEEDEDRIRQIERIAQQAGCTQKLQEEIHDWLKSLRPSWKPSEEQMDALKELIDDANRAGWVTPGATELYEQLKKLQP